MLRKWLKWMAIGLGVLTALLIITIAGAWVWITSDAGSAFITGKVKTLASAAIKGKVDFTSIRLKGTTLSAEGVKLYDPDGKLVAEVASLQATVDVLGLRPDNIHLSSVFLDGVRLYLKQDDDGLNLMRAVAPSKVAQVVPDEKASGGIAIRVDTLELTHSYVDYVAPDRHIRADRITAKAGARVHTSPLTLDGQIDLSSDVTEPLGAPLKLNAQLSTDSKQQMQADVQVSLADTAIIASGTWPELTASVKKLKVTPEVVKAFVPSWPIVSPIDGVAELGEGKATASLTVGSAKIEAKTAYAKDFATFENLAVDVEGLNLAELTAGGKPSLISAHITGALSDPKPETLTANAKVSATWKTPPGATLATVDVDAKADKGTIQIPRMNAVVPGTRVSLNGSMTTKRVGLNGEIVIDDLSKISSVIEEFSGSKPPKLAGKGTISAKVSGQLTHPSVSLKGSLAGLTAASVSVQQLDLSADVPDATRPLHASASVDAKGLLLGGRTLDEVRASISAQGRSFEANIATKGLGDTALKLAGTLNDESTAVELNALALTYEGGAWTLGGPTRVSWGGGELHLGPPLVLRSDRQKISLTAHRTARSTDAQLIIDSFDLGKLPPIAGTGAIGLTGFVSGTVDVSGSEKSPTVNAQLTVKDITVQNVQNINGTIAATLEKNQVSLKSALSSSIGALQVSGGASLNALSNSQNADPLEAHLKVEKIDLETVATAFKQDLPVKGEVSVEADLSGTRALPLLTVRAKSQKLDVSVRDGLITVSALEMTVSPANDGRVTASVSLGALGGAANVGLTSPWTLAQLLAHVPTVDEVKRAPIEGTVTVLGVELKQVVAARLIESDDMAGSVSLDAKLSGSVLAPRAEVTVSADRVNVYPFNNLGGTLKLSAKDATTSVDGTISAAGKTVVVIDGSIAAPFEQAINTEELCNERMSLSVSLRPFEVKDVLKATQENSTTTGVVSATVVVSGTPSAPSVDAAADIQNLSFSSLVLGSARFSLKSDGLKQNLAVTLGGVGRDDLRIRGSVTGDFSLPAIRKGLNVAQMPFDVSINARNLDVGFLSGVSPMVRALAGKLNMEGGAHGTIGEPVFKTDLRWTDGRVALLGVGDYRNVELDLTADNNSITINTLKARSGAGSASLKAEIIEPLAGFFGKDATDRTKLHVEGDADKFPVITDDQLRAMVTTKLDIDGVITKESIRISKVGLSGVLVEMPEVKRKNVQDVDRPNDIVLLRNRQAVARRLQEKSRKAQERAQQPAGRRITIIVDAPHVNVRSSDFNLHLQVSEGFRIEVNQGVQIFGRARVLDNSRLSVLGRDFTFQGSLSSQEQVVFAGAASEPNVDITAVHINEKISPPVKIFVRVTMRPGSGIKWTISSPTNPELTETELYTVLATGRLGLGRGVGASITGQQAASLVGSVAANYIKDYLEDKILIKFIDVVNVELPEDRGLRLQLGKYLTDKIYLEYKFDGAADPTKGQNPHAGRLQYQLPKNFSLEATAGNAPAATADVVWSVDF